MAEVLLHGNQSKMIWRANQWTGFFMIEASVIKELKEGIENSFGKLRSLKIKEINQKTIL